MRDSTSSPLSNVSPFPGPAARTQVAGKRPGPLPVGPGHQKPWLARLPVGLFGICVGLFALAGAWRRSGALGWALSPLVADVIAYAAAALLLALSLLYGAKALRHKAAVVGEVHHPLARSLMALIPLSYLQATVYFGQASEPLWLQVVLLALVAHAFISFRLVALLATGAHTQLAITPALYVPPLAGGLVGAMAMSNLGYAGWATFLLGVALSSWAILELRILNRLFEGPLPEPMRPTIGFELAPPTVATLAVSVIWPQLPAEYLMIGLGISAGPVVAVFARYKWWASVPFSAGFWSFSFPLAALASAIVVIVTRGGWPHWIASVALLGASGVVAFLSYKTLVLLAKGRLLPPG